MKAYLLTVSYANALQDFPVPLRPKRTTVTILSSLTYHTGVA